MHANLGYFFSNQVIVDFEIVLFNTFLYKLSNWTDLSALYFQFAYFNEA